jgi:hypothetical protein
MFASLAPAVRSIIFLAWLAVSFVVPFSALAQSDPLPSWNEGAVKKSIADFVARVTAPGSADFVPPERRIATFDNDGTLWCEQPVYFQLAFVVHNWTVVDMKRDWKTVFPFEK